MHWSGAGRYGASGSGLKEPQAGAPVLRRGAFPSIKAPYETVGKGRYPIFETTSGVVLGWRGPQRGYPATAVTAPGRYSARPAYAAAPLEKRGRPARADLGAHGRKPALRFAGARRSELRPPQPTGRLGAPVRGPGPAIFPPSCGNAGRACPDLRGNSGPAAGAAASLGGAVGEQVSAGAGGRL